MEIMEMTQNEIATFFSSAIGSFFCLATKKKGKRNKKKDVVRKMK